MGFSHIISLFITTPISVEESEITQKNELNILQRGNILFFFEINLK